MTIAACYLSPEGVVLGADSAATFGSRQHFFHTQKIFEIGKSGESTLGLSLWGLGSMEETSYRTLIGRFSDEVVRHPDWPVRELATRWATMFWDEYKIEYANDMLRIRQIKSKTSLSEDESLELDDLINDGSGGFCVGGYSLPDRVPKAFAITYSPDMDVLDGIEELVPGMPEFWGQPNMLRRLSLGIGMDTLAGILNAKGPDGSKLWKGTDDELIAIILENKLGRPSKHLPIREAIDWVYSSVYTTIKAMKFANMPPVCGGPIEVAVITSDRYFRWVRHKDLDTAIGHHPMERRMG